MRIFLSLCLFTLFSSSCSSKKATKYHVLQESPSPKNRPSNLLAQRWKKPLKGDKELKPSIFSINYSNHQPTKSK